jgi:hypothetical protein
MDDQEKVIEDLTLALVFLTSWTERNDDMPRSWKGYDFEVLNALAERGLIEDSRRAKSAYLTPDGVEQARAILSRLGIQ